METNTNSPKTKYGNQQTNEQMDSLDMKSIIQLYKFIDQQNENDEANKKDLDNNSNNNDNQSNNVNNFVNNNNEVDNRTVKSEYVYYLIH